MIHPVAINPGRLMDSLHQLGKVGALPGGGVKRLALTDADKAGRELVVGWMQDMGLAVSIDTFGNTWGVRAAGAPGNAPAVNNGADNTPMVMIGSHIDTVATGGLYDGNLGVLAGLEVIRTLDDAGIQTRRPVGVAFFTNEEGARFAPDMMGSGVHQGALDINEMLAVTDADGVTVADALEQTGCRGDVPPASIYPASFLELHIEQGPVLEEAGIQIGAVTGVQGISWTEFTIRGVSNHAGTTPMRLRHDAGYVAAQIAVLARQIASNAGPPQVATVGAIRLSPNLVNVVPREAVITVDLRHTDDTALKNAEQQLFDAAQSFAQQEGCTIEQRSLARFAPVDFDPDIIDAVEQTAAAMQLSVQRMPSGAGHDAQMFAPNCPTGMIFVQSHKGLSHNVKEYTAPEHLEAGTNVLLQLVLQQAGVIDGETSR